MALRIRRGPSATIISYGLHSYGLNSYGPADPSWPLGVCRRTAPNERGRGSGQVHAPPGGSAGIEAPVCAAKLTQQRNAYYIVMAYVVMAYVVMAYIAAARLSLVGQRVGAGGLLKPSPLVVAEAHFELGLRHPLGSSTLLTAASRLSSAREEAIGSRRP